MAFTEKKFKSLTIRSQHKHASELIKAIFLGDLEEIPSYQALEKWLCLPPINPANKEELSNRYHLHLENAGLCKKEHGLLHVRHQDTKSITPFLPIHILLCSFRSAFNVGSILRTTEAFRLGTVHFFGHTATPENPKVQKASMGTHDLVPCNTKPNLDSLPRPWIALETASPSTPLSAFSFPETFTLILGNEEFGVPQEILKKCDVILEIPLQGNKNSLNVASAFAITAAYIRDQKKP
jgi:tRNA G18 (ribose-2'-O)-methylase SpoU